MNWLHALTNKSPFQKQRLSVLDVINSNKCKVMLISRKGTLLDRMLFFICIDNHLRVKSYKYLRINLTEDLTWSHHIDIICAKAHQVLGLLYRRFYYCDPTTLISLFTSLVCPHLEYTCPVWSPPIPLNPLTNWNVFKNLAWDLWRMNGKWVIMTFLTIWISLR